MLRPDLADRLGSLRRLLDVPASSPLTERRLTLARSVVSALLDAVNAGPIAEGPRPAMEGTARPIPARTTLS